MNAALGHCMMLMDSDWSSQTKQVLGGGLVDPLSVHQTHQVEACILVKMVT